MRYLWTWIASVVVLAVVIALGLSIAQNPNIDHAAIVQYQFAPAILAGLRTTIELAVISGIIGLGLGLGLALMRLSQNPVLRWASGAYTWAFRGTPLLVQILFWGNLALLFKHVGIGLVSVPTNTLVTPFVASILALALNEGAYMSEIIRAGILAVPTGQVDAARALGMSSSLTMRKVVLPQAFAVIVPPTVNQFTNLLKATSLVSVIAGGDLLTAAENIASANLHTIELLIVATFWFLVITSLSGVAQHVVEARLAPA
ncbi:MAG: amino acid ABC transporter permease [Vulcanimicrobiaceae bacterium]|jgi:polar amino acid transport system permease protein